MPPPSNEAAVVFARLAAALYPAEWATDAWKQVRQVAPIYADVVAALRAQFAEPQRRPLPQVPLPERFTEVLREYSDPIGVAEALADGSTCASVATDQFLSSLSRLPNWNWKSEAAMGQIVAAYNEKTHLQATLERKHYDWLEAVRGTCSRNRALVRIIELWVAAAIKPDYRLEWCVMPEDSEKLRLDLELPFIVRSQLDLLSTVFATRSENTRISSLIRHALDECRGLQGGPQWYGILAGKE